jgi:pimeloyl-ACP methyl ester carboxylesterase
MSARRARKPPVLMIHGAFCGPWAMEGFAEMFREAGYTVHVPALRFHEMRPAPSALATTSLADYAADLEEEIAALAAPPILVGHSMGGLLAQMLAARLKIAAGILLAPSPPWGVSPASLSEIAAASALLLRPVFWTQLLKPDRHIALSQSLGGLPPESREAVFARLGPESGRAMLEIMHWGLDMTRASATVPGAVTCPLLLLAGAEDKVNAPGTVARIAARYGQHATLETLPCMGHWLIGEPGWEKLAARAIAWLDDLQR